MAKKFLSIVVLVCMTLHCCSRLGVISYVYANRFDLAYALGMTAERVISMCSADHFQRSQLNIQPEKETQFPTEVAQAREIVLCCPPLIVSISRPFRLIDSDVCWFVVREYASPYSDIFHPPAALS